MSGVIVAPAASAVGEDEEGDKAEGTSDALSDDNDKVDDRVAEDWSRRNQFCAINAMRTDMPMPATKDARETGPSMERAHDFLHDVAEDEVGGGIGVSPPPKNQ